MNTHSKRPSLLSSLSLVLGLALPAAGALAGEAPDAQAQAQRVMISAITGSQRHVTVFAAAIVDIQTQANTVMVDHHPTLPGDRVLTKTAHLDAQESARHLIAGTREGA